MWCKEKGFSIEHIAGYGNCLYSCLGKSRKIPGDKVRQIVHDNAERLWSTHVHHDVDESELIDFKNRTLDKNAWGQFDQIIIWSKIYLIQIEIYCFSMNMQTIDGDEFMADKACIRLLYCNKNKWGDAENHYDLMHPIPQHICKGKAYDRRSESDQCIYEQNKNMHPDEQRQTKINDDKAGQRNGGK
eukprot:12610734-Heterocapsa_arctica.AAC.1